MVTLPAGFDAALFVADLSSLGVLLVTSAVVVCAGVVVMKVFRR